MWCDSCYNDEITEIPEFTRDILAGYALKARYTGALSLRQVPI